MTTSFVWRGRFDNREINALHAEAFDTRVFEDSEWDWQLLTAAHSLGWVTARDESIGLVGFVNVLWDGLAHAWIQDLMVAGTHRSRGIGQRLSEAAANRSKAAGCEWLHVDFEDHLRSFYIDACGFAPTNAGLMRL